MAHEHQFPKSRALVVVPTYNEAHAIQEVARRLFSAVGERVDLLVVDDASPDGTARAVRAIGSPRVHLIERPFKMGLASAYLTAFAWALEHDYDAVVEMDGDLSHDPGVVQHLIDALADADLVIGSRWVEGGDVTNWGRLRVALSRAGNMYTRAVLGAPVNDWTSGYRAYRSSWLASADLGDISSQGYAFQIEMTRRVIGSGGSIVEIPIVFVERAEGASKISPGIVAEAALSVAAWGVSDLLAGRRHPPYRNTSPRRPSRGSRFAPRGGLPRSSRGPHGRAGHPGRPPRGTR
jgi:dolichol-phosphate mannosyltransferase